jgi:hypothetical protein
MAAAIYLPLEQYIDQLLPANLVELPDVEALQKIWIEPLNFTVEPASFKTIFLIEDELVLGIPGVDAVQLVLAGTGGASTFLLEFDSQPTPQLRFGDIPITLRFSKDVLQPVRKIATDDGSDQWEPVPDATTVDIVLARITLVIDFDGNITLQTDLSIDLPPVMIGTTGVIIEARGLQIYLDANNPPPGKPAGWRGVHIGTAQLHLPGDLGATVGTLALTDAYIGNGGFSGTVSDTWTQPLSAKLFGAQVSLSSAALTFVQNTLTRSEIAGSIMLPFFEKPVDVMIAVNLDGSFSCKLAASGGLLTLTKDGVLSLELDSFGFEVSNQLFTVKLGGQVQPLIGSPGLRWPQFQLQELSIDSQGRVAIAGGWLSLPSQYCLDFHGFKIEISQLGFGKTDDGGKWIGFSGGVKLVEGLPAGASVEGLRVIWYDDGSGRGPRVSFRGIGIEFAVPDVFEFKGAISYRDPYTMPITVNGVAGQETIERIDGAIDLKLDCFDLEVDGKLVVGHADSGGLRPSYNFFALYIGVELPAGIPLFSTGLGFYGFAALFATQMGPNRHPEEGWYENIDGGPGWYKRDQPGVTDLAKKWDPQLGSLALGLGTTIGTMPDNGQSFHGKFLLVIVLPGPIIMLEGRGDLLKKRSEDDGGGASAEPLFRAIAVLDGRQGTFTIGLDAQYKYDDPGGKLIDIRGSAETFFSFHDLSAWHIYVGRDTPEQYRIHALLFSFLKANAYFMLQGKDPFFRQGAYVGYSFQASYSVVSVDLEAFIRGDATLSLKPPHFSASLVLHGSLKVAAFGFGLELLAEASVAADVLTPFDIVLGLDVVIKLPWPVPHVEAHLKKEWGPTPDPPPLALPLKEVAIEHLKVTTTWPLARSQLLLPNYEETDDFMHPDGSYTGATAPPGLANNDYSALPVVPLDARPHLTFARSVNDDAMVGVNVQPGSGAWETIGDPSKPSSPVQARFGLKSVTLESHGGGSVWNLVATAPSTDPAKLLYGSWAPVPSMTGAGDNVDQTKLWLWSRNPFDFTSHTGGAWDESFGDRFPSYPCVPAATDRTVCVDVSGVDPTISGPTWSSPDLPGLTLQWPISDGTVQTGSFTVTLPRGATDVTITPGQSGHQRIRRCVDFQTYPTGTGSNPRTELGVRFLVLTATGGTSTPAPSSTIIQTAGHGGLKATPELHISLPKASTGVILLLSQGGAASIEALRVDQLSLGHWPIPTGFRSFRVPTAGVSEIVIRSNGETTLHEICYEYTLVSAVGSRASDKGVIASSTGTDGTITLSGPGLSSVTVTVDTTDSGRTGTDPTKSGVEEICVTFPPDPQDVALRNEMSQHLRDAMDTWSQTGPVLESYTAYRLTVVTTVEARSQVGLSGWQAQGSGSGWGPNEQTQFAYFRTGGPIGLGANSIPPNAVLNTVTAAGTASVTAGSAAVTGSAAAGWSENLIGDYFRVNGDPDSYQIIDLTPAPPALTLDRQYGGSTTAAAAYVIGTYADPLGDLSPYVRQTTPPTVPPAGSAPVLPRPVYRAYDVGVDFNEDYVDLMYRKARRDLGLYLYNSNNEPVRDAQGRLVMLTNRWGVQEHLTLSETDQRWVNTVNQSTCAQVNTAAIPVDQRLSSASNAQVLDADTVYEARLIPLLCHDDFESVAVGTTASGSGAFLGQWQVLDMGTVSAPSRWQVMQDGAPPAVFLTQTASISGGTDIGTDPAKPGTLLLRAAMANLPANHPDQPSKWTDYRATVFVRATTGDGAMGVVVRYQDATHYYQLSMDRKRRYRRLLKIVDSTLTVLAEDDFAYSQNLDYLITVEAVGSAIRVYQDGEAVFTVSDSSVAAGGFGLYCWNNAGVEFRDVRIDDFRMGAPSVYRFQFTTSQYTNFNHLLHSYQDETWSDVIPGATSLGDALTQLVTPSATNTLPAITEPEARAWETLASAALGPASKQPPSTVETHRVSQNSAALGWLLRSPEPIDWARTTVQILRLDRHIPAPAVPGATKLTAVAFGTDPFISLLLRDDAVDVTSARVEQRQLPGPLAAGNGPTLLADNFSGAPSGVVFWESFAVNGLDRYTVVSQQPPGNATPQWRVANGRIEEIVDYRGGTAADDDWKRPGTVLLLRDQRYRNVRLTVTLESVSQRDIGVVFRYQDENNYYRLSLVRFDAIRSSAIRRLVKKVNGTASILWEDQVGHNARTTVAVDMYNDRFIGFIDQRHMFDVTDGDINDGTVGLYCWGNAQAYFDLVEVETIESDPLLWQPTLDSLEGWTVVEDTATVGGPSQWSAAEGRVSQTSAIAGRGGEWKRLPGEGKDIAVGVKGAAWSIGARRETGGFAIQQWSGSNWKRTADGAVRIAVDDGGQPWVVDSNHQVLHGTGSAGGWTKLPGSATDIGASAAGFPTYIVSTTATTGGFDVVYWDLTSWKSMSFGAVRVAVGPDGTPYVVNDKNQISAFSWNSGQWQQLAGTAQDVGVGADGSVWVVQVVQTGRTETAPGPVARWNGATWEVEPGATATAIAVGPEGNPWIVGGKGDLLRWDGNIRYKPGTCLLGGSPGWTDVQIFATLQADGGGAVGVVFRYIDNDNYLRFSADRSGNYRRLIKKVSGQVSTLWEAAGPFDLGSHDVAIVAVGGWIEAYLDGAQLLRIYDGDLQRGRIGLYSGASPTAQFSRIVVRSGTRRAGRWAVRDDGELNGPSRWLSQGELSQSSGITQADTTSALGTHAVAGDAAWRNYRLSVRLRTDANGALGVLFRYVNDGNYYRFAIDATLGVQRLTRVQNRTVATLWEKPTTVTLAKAQRLTLDVIGSRLIGQLDGQSLFDLADATHAAGQVGFYASTNSGARFEEVQVQMPPLELAALFHDRFANQDMSAWQIIDSGTLGAPSSWQIVSGHLCQTSGIHSDPPSDGGQTVGTQAVVKDMTWNDFVMTATLSSATGDAIGVCVRYSAQGHYRLVMSNTAAYRRLIKQVGTTETVLWEDAVAYDPTLSYEVSMVVMGATLRAYVNGVPVFTVVDRDVIDGSVGLFCAGNPSATFSRVLVFPSQYFYSGWLLQDGFELGALQNWSIYDAGTQGAPSQWQTVGRELQQTSAISDGSTDPTDPAKAGTYALAGDSTWSDYRLMVRLRSGSSGAIGAVVRYADAAHFYRFSMDSSLGYRRLVKNVGATVTVLWEDKVAFVEGRNYVLTLDCERDRLTGYLDSYRLFQVEDGDVGSGRIGLYCCANNSAYFADLRLAPPEWYLLYAFGRETPLPAGTRFRLYVQGIPEDPAPAGPDEVLRVRTDIAASSASLTPSEAELRVVDAQGNVGHRRYFAPDTSYTAVAVKALRSRDGTELALWPGAAPASGEYRLKLSYSKQRPGLVQLSQAGDTSPEVVVLDIPWVTV